jgi:hypothetical protein
MPRTATLSADASVYNLNGLAPSAIAFTPFSGSSMQILGGRGGNTFNVESTLAGTTTTINAGSGGSTINLSPVAHNLANLAGLVAIHGQGGTNTLNAFDQDKTFSSQFRGDNLYRDHLTRVDPIERTLFTFDGMQGINVSAGHSPNGTLDGPEGFGVASTPAGVPVTVSNAGTSTNYMQFLVYNSAYSLEDIRGPLTIHGRQGGSDVLELDDLGANTAPSYTFNAAAGTGAGTVSRSGTALIGFDNQTKRVLYASPVAGTNVNVQSTSADVITAIVVQDGATVTLGTGGTLSGLARWVGITTDARQQAPNIVLDDSGDATPRHATFNIQGDLGYGVSGLAGSDGSTPITWSLGPNARINAQVLGGSGGNTFNVERLLSGTALTLNAGIGGPGDCFHITPTGQYLADIAGTLTLNGSGSGLDILDFFDQNNPNAETYNFDAVPSNLTLMTVPVSINFNGFAGTSVYLETNGFSTVNDASGQVNVDVPPPCLPDTGPDQAVLAQVLVEAAQKQGALPRNAPPVTEAMADDLVAHAAKMPDPWALLDWSA